MSNIVKFPGILEPGLFNDRYIAEAQYIKDTIIVVDSVAEANDIKNKSILRAGTPIYVIEKQKFYRYSNGTFEYDESILDSVPADSKIYGLQEGGWKDLSEVFASVEDIKNFYTKDEVDIKFNVFKAELNSELSSMVSEEVAKSAKEVITLSSKDELNLLTPEAGKLYIVTEENAMYTINAAGDDFSCLGVYFPPATSGEEGESGPEMTEDQVVVMTGGSAESLG